LEEKGKMRPCIRGSIRNPECGAGRDLGLIHWPILCSSESLSLPLWHVFIQSLLETQAWEIVYIPPPHYHHITSPPPHHITTTTTPPSWGTRIVDKAETFQTVKSNRYYYTGLQSKKQSSMKWRWF
jgi:hypothetical protein